MFHNLNAIFQVDYDRFLGSVHHRFQDGLVYTEIPRFQSFSPITLNITRSQDI